MAWGGKQRSRTASPAGSTLAARKQAKRERDRRRQATKRATQPARRVGRVPTDIDREAWQANDRFVATADGGWYEACNQRRRQLLAGAGRAMAVTSVLSLLPADSLATIASQLSIAQLGKCACASKMWYILWRPYFRAMEASWNRRLRAADEHVKAAGGWKQLLPKREVSTAASGHKEKWLLEMSLDQVTVRSARGMKVHMSHAVSCMKHMICLCHDDRAPECRLCVLGKHAPLRMLPRDDDAAVERRHRDPVRGTRSRSLALRLALG